MFSSLDPRRQRQRLRMLTVLACFVTLLPSAQAWTLTIGAAPRRVFLQVGNGQLNTNNAQIAALTAQWSTQGRLLPGRIGPGERTLVYQGVMPDKSLEDRLQLYLMVNGEWMSSSRRLEFYFELDTE